MPDEPAGEPAPDPQVAEVEAPRPAQDAEPPVPKVDLSSLPPVEALEALGGTVKVNVKGEPVSVDLKETEVTEVTEQGIERLQRSLPNCQIVW